MMRRCRDVHIDNCWWVLSSACIREFGIACDKLLNLMVVRLSGNCQYRRYLLVACGYQVLYRGPLKRERLLLIKLFNLMVVRLTGNFCVCIHHR